VLLCVIDEVSMTTNKF